MVTNCNQLKMEAADGKNYLTDVANAETLLRLVQSVPSPKAEPIKLWLAKVGYERMQEMSDPARELEVLGHVVQGRLNKQIADDLGIHERTVKLHRTAITTKLGVPSVAELTRLAHEAGVFPAVAPTFPKGQ